jgi:hypothetical protein
MNAHHLTTFVYETFGQQFGDLILAGYGEKPGGGRRRLYLTESGDGAEADWMIELVAFRLPCEDDHQGENELAREQYMAAVEIFSGNSDIMKEYRGDTYLRWATQEYEWSYPDNAETYFSEARRIFESKANPIARRRSIARLNDHMDRIYPSSLPAHEKHEQSEVAAEEAQQPI